jgi:hypothetical protein
MELSILFNSIDTILKSKGVSSAPIIEIIRILISDDNISDFYITEIARENENIILDMLVLGNRTLYGYSLDKDINSGFMKMDLKNIVSIDENKDNDKIIMNIQGNGLAGYSLTDKIDKHEKIDNFVLAIIKKWK